MGKDMVNNIISEMMNVKVESAKKQSTTSKTQKIQSNDFNSILKNIKSEKVDISKLTKETKRVDIEGKTKNTEKITKNDSKISKDNTKIEDIEMEEVEEKVDNLSVEEIIQCLSAIVDKIQEISEGNNINIDELSIESINGELKETLIYAISDSKDMNFNTLSTVVQDSSKDNSAVSIVNNILEMLNENNMDEILDKDNLSLANSLLNTLGIKLEEESSLGNENSFLKNLVSEVKNEINKLISQDTNLQISNTNELQQGGILSSLNAEESEMSKNGMLINSKAEDNTFNVKNELQYNEKSLVDDSNSNKGSSNENSNSENSSTSFSKDEKILNSILKGSNSNNTNTFAMPVSTTIVQNNGDMAITEVQVINKDSMVADVIKIVKYMTTNTMKEMIVKINPNNLGEVTIKLVEENGIMKMNIKASSKETYSLLSQQANEMKNQLNDQNIKIQDVNISLYEDDTTFFKEGEFNNNSFQEDRRKKNNNNTANDEGLSEEKDIDTNYINTSAINMLA